MNLKKGLSYVAFGCLFTLVNLNFNFQNRTLNVMPNFIGWILLFRAFNRLGTYIEGKKYLKWISLAMIILTGTIWVIQFAKPVPETDILTTIETIISLIYMYILFGTLEKIAKDYNSPRESAIHVMRIINLVISVSFLVSGLGFMASGAALAGDVTTVLGIAGMVAVIVTLVVLFKMRKEIIENIAEQ